MPLSQTARSQFHTRQKNRLLLCLGAAIAAHGLLFVGWSLEQRETRRQPTGVEFVYLEPTANPTLDKDKPDTSRRAQVDSDAGGTTNPELPISAGKASQNNPVPPTPDRPLPPSPPQSAAQAAAQSAAQSTPQPVSNPAPNPVPSPVPPRPSPTISRPAPRAVNRSPAISQAAQLAMPQTTAAPRPANPAPPAASIATFQAGQGLDGQINPDRSGNGTAGPDAAADAVWGAYVSTLNRKIDQNWQRIAVSAMRQAKVQFDIDRQGQLINLRLVQSSGDADADQVALQAVRQSVPFAPFPGQVAESRLRVNFTFTYYPAGQAPTN